MKSLLTKRLPGILAVGLVALAVGAASAPASASDAQISGLTGAQKKAKSKAITKCKKKFKKNAKKKKSCIKKVIKKYNKLANTPPKGENTTVELGDNFYAPAVVDLKVNDSITWSWANVGGFEPHDVTMVTGPAGVSRDDFKSSTTAVQSTRFTRTFDKAGQYSFVCSIHYAMTMTVQVSK